MPEARALVATLVLTTLSITSAQAQGIFVTNGQMVGLLFERRVKAELRLDEDQVKRAAKAFESQMARNRENAKMVRELGLVQPQAQEVFAAYSRNSVAEYKKELAGFLTPAQLKRLREITVQRLQGVALEDPDLQDEVRLTEEQKAKIEQSRRRKVEKTKPLLDIMRTNPKNREAVFSLMKAVDQEHNDNVLAVLTKAQKKLWEEMQGPRFDPQ